MERKGKGRRKLDFEQDLNLTICGRMDLLVLVLHMLQCISVRKLRLPRVFVPSAEKDCFGNDASPRTDVLGYLCSALAGCGSRTEATIRNHVPIES